MTAQRLHRQGIDVNVVGVGTASGAPAPDGNGGFVRDASGQVVLTRLDSDLLQRVATAGGGRFVPLSALPQLVGDLQRRRLAYDERRRRGTESKARELAQRRRLAAARASPTGRADRPAGLDMRHRGPHCWQLNSASPPSWAGRRWRPTHRAHGPISGARRTSKGRRCSTPGSRLQAAERFQDPRRRAYADLEAGHYDDAAKQLAPFNDVQSEYNRGNALARSGNLQAALAAYDAALKQAPADVDIRHNRDLVARALQQQRQSPQSSSKMAARASSRRPAPRKQGRSGSRQSGNGSQSAGGNQPAPNGSPAGANRPGNGAAAACNRQRRQLARPKRPARHNAMRRKPRPSPVRSASGARQVTRRRVRTRSETACWRVVHRLRNSNPRASGNWRSISGCARSPIAPPACCSASFSSST